MLVSLSVMLSAILRPYSRDSADTTKWCKYLVWFRRLVSKESGISCLCTN